jgi:transcriptional regulator with XRE-family HTH domain
MDEMDEMDEIEKRGIAIFLERELKERGWTREYLCERTGITLERLDQMPNEVIVHYLGELWQIAEVFGMTRMQALARCAHGNDSAETVDLDNRPHEVFLGFRPVLYRMVQKSLYLSEEDILQVERRVDALLDAKGIRPPFM